MVAIILDERHFERTRVDELLLTRLPSLFTRDLRLHIADLLARREVSSPNCIEALELALLWQQLK